MDEKIDILLQQRGGRWPRHRVELRSAQEVEEEQEVLDCDLR